MDVVVYRSMLSKQPSEDSNRRQQQKTATEDSDVYFMASASNEKNIFVHQVAIKLSRQLNTINTNDLLAERVIDIAKTKTAEDFTTGVFRSRVLVFKLMYFSCEIFWQVQGFILARTACRDFVA